LLARNRLSLLINQKPTVFDGGLLIEKLACRIISDVLQKKESAMIVKSSPSQADTVHNISLDENPYTFPVAQLLTYGDCVEKDIVDEWPNYLELGFTKSDVPELHRL
jgi:hypothetical protein